MKRYKITHHTIYTFPGFVKLLPHSLRLRPREGHELRIESSKLDIFPTATLRWHRDVEGNSVLIASFADKTKTLAIKSEILIQQYDLVPLDFLVADYAVGYPFSYLENDSVLLGPYLGGAQDTGNPLLAGWLDALWHPSEKIQSITLLQRLNQRIYETIVYQQREEEGVQSAEKTLACGSGSCRDFTNLFMVAAQKLGFATRFVSGYVYPNSTYDLSGSTHAWAEVFIPGAGWKGFDPTNGGIVGGEHIAVAVARLPESVPPVAGSYLGTPESIMKVDVQVTDADDS